MAAGATGRGWARWWPLGVFAIALAVRGLHLWQIRSAPFFRLKLADAQSYDAWARAIVGGDWVGREVFYQAPLYPYFLAAVYGLLGDDMALVRVAQAVIGAGSCVLLAHAGRRLFSPGIGITAGVMLALYPTAVFFDTILQKTVLSTFFLCLLLALLAELTLRPRWTASIGAGLALGALILSRENAILFAPVILAWLLLFGAARARRWSLAAAFVAGLAVLLLPVALRNHAVGGEFELTTAQFGPNLYLGNNAHANGSYRPLVTGRSDPKFERHDATLLAEQMSGKRLAPSEVSSFWARKSLEYIRTHPLDWLALKARTLALLLNAFEIEDGEDFYTYTDWSWPLRLMARVWHFGVLAPLAVIGLWVTWGDRRRLSILYLATGTYAASVVLFFVFARYRMPLVPLLTLFAAPGAAWAPKLARGASRTAVAGCVAAVVAVAVFANWPTMVKDRSRSFMYANIGGAVAEQRGYADALPFLQKARRLWPMSPVTQNSLGIAYYRTGDLSRAVRHFRNAVRMNPEYEEAVRNLRIAEAELQRAEAQGPPAEEPGRPQRRPEETGPGS